MKTKTIKLSVGLILSTTLGVSQSQGQVAPKEPDAEDETIVLSPFVVNAEEDTGYQATSVLSGSRLRTPLSEIAAPISVITSDFMRDTNSTTLRDLLVYTTNTEVGGFDGNYSGVDKSSNFSQSISLLSNANGPTRVRGLSSADLTRSFFPTLVPLDGYNTERIEISRGANAMLFGLGSPAGIINANLKTPSLTRDRYMFTTSVGRFGSFRNLVDIDESLFKDQLGVRIMLLDDDKKYKQKFTFNHDRRLFVAAKWASRKIGRTEINVDFERGLIDSSRPRPTPPVDRLSAWYDPNVLNKITKNPGNGDADVADPVITAHLDTAGRWFNRQAAVWADPNSSIQGGPGLPETMPGTGGVDPFQVWSAVANYASAANSPLHFLNRNFGLPTGVALNGLWKNQEILDSSVFDFYNYNLEGPNKGVWDDFDALNINLRQTFWSDSVGFELAHNREESDQTRFNQILHDEYGVMIDMITHLFDGSPNPNFGRPYFVGEAAGGTSAAERRGDRATAYAEFDFKRFTRPEGAISRIFGRHVLTGTYSKLESSSFATGFSGYGYTLDQNQYADDPNATGYPFWAGMHYLGDRIDHLNSPQGAHIRGVVTERVPKTTAQALIYDRRVDQWVNAPVTTIDWQNNRDLLYTSASKSRNEAKSLSLTWQSTILDGTVSGIVGWRRDTFKSFSPGALQRAPITNEVLPFDPAWTYNPTPSVEAEGSSRSWGVVVHTPRFIKKYYPRGLDINLAYNEGSNFRPSATTANAYGEAFPSPSGESEDMSAIVSAFDGKLVLRVTKYETSQLNDRSTFMVPFWIGNGIIRGMNGLRTTPVHEAIINKWFGFEPGDPNYLPLRASLSNPAQQNNVVPPLTAAEVAARNLWFSQRTREEWLRPVDPKLAETWSFVQNAAGTWSATTPANVGNVADTVSKGLEFELTYNPTKTWRIFATVAQQEASRAGLGADFADFVERNKGIWLDGNRIMATRTIEMDGFEDITHFNGFGANMVGLTTVNNLYVPYLIALSADGAPVDELREWRANVVTNYTFASGRFKGFSIGGAARWQSRSAIGFPAIYEPEADLYISDVRNPFYADAELDVDLTVSYTRKIVRDKVDWTIQLNVRDIFGSDALIPIQAQPDGSIASARIPQANLWTITNSFAY